MNTHFSSKQGYQIYSTDYDMADEEANQIASLVLEQFDKLPAKRKPALRGNGIQEWVPMSSIVAKGLHFPAVHVRSKMLISLFPVNATKLHLAKGTALHDWHAEILTIRSFNHFLLEECKAIASGQGSHLIRRRAPEERSQDGQPWERQPFALKDDITLHMYCSEAPCGDASMELTMADQEDASPWEIPPPPVLSPTPDTPTTDTEATTGSLPGRAYFSSLGIVRRKPSRPDAPPTLSKSCSDKLSLHQCTTLLSSLTSLLIHPSNAYLTTIILPSSSYSPTGCTRAFNPTGRMAPLTTMAWEGGYAYCPFDVAVTDREFAFSKRAVRERTDKVSASNLAVAWDGRGMEEGLVGGVLQGRRQFDVRGGSRTCRRRMWELVIEVARMDGTEDVCRLLEVGRYGDIGLDGGLEERRRVKEDVRATALRGWVRNKGDEEFGL